MTDQTTADTAIKQEECLSFSKSLRGSKEENANAIYEYANEHNIDTQVVVETVEIGLALQYLNLKDVKHQRVHLETIVDRATAIIIRKKNNRRNVAPLIDNMKELISDINTLKTTIKEDACSFESLDEKIKNLKAVFWEGCTYEMQSLTQEMSEQTFGLRELSKKKQEVEKYNGLFQLYEDKGSELDNLLSALREACQEHDSMHDVITTLHNLGQNDIQKLVDVDNRDPLDNKLEQLLSKLTKVVYTPYMDEINQEKKRLNRLISQQSIESLAVSEQSIDSVYKIKSLYQVLEALAVVDDAPLRLALEKFIDDYKNAIDIDALHQMTDEQQSQLNEQLLCLQNLCSILPDRHQNKEQYKAFLEGAELRLSIQRTIEHANREQLNINQYMMKSTNGVNDEDEFEDFVENITFLNSWLNDIQDDVGEPQSVDSLFFQYCVAKKTEFEETLLKGLESVKPIIQDKIKTLLSGEPNWSVNKLSDFIEVLEILQTPPAPEVLTQIKTIVKDMKDLFERQDLNNLDSTKEKLALFIQALKIEPVSNDAQLLKQELTELLNSYDLSTERREENARSYTVYTQHTHREGPKIDTNLDRKQGNVNVHDETLDRNETGEEDLRVTSFEQTSLSSQEKRSEEVGQTAESDADTQNNDKLILIEAREYYDLSEEKRERFYKSWFERKISVADVAKNVSPYAATKYLTKMFVNDPLSEPEKFIDAIRGSLPEVADQAIFEYSKYSRMKTGNFLTLIAAEYGENIKIDDLELDVRILYVGALIKNVLSSPEEVEGILKKYSCGFTIKIYDDCLSDDQREKSQEVFFQVWYSKDKNIDYICKNAKPATHIQYAGFLIKEAIINKPEKLLETWQSLTPEVASSVYNDLGDDERKALKNKFFDYAVDNNISPVSIVERMNMEVALEYIEKQNQYNSTVYTDVVKAAIDKIGIHSFLNNFDEHYRLMQFKNVQGLMYDALIEKGVTPLNFIQGAPRTYHKEYMEHLLASSKYSGPSSFIERVQLLFRGWIRIAFRIRASSGLKPVAEDSSYGIVSVVGQQGATNPMASPQAPVSTQEASSEGPSNTC